jgi:hypothetical protein
MSSILLDNIYLRVQLTCQRDLRSLFRKPHVLIAIGASLHRENCSACADLFFFQPVEVHKPNAINAGKILLQRNVLCRDLGENNCRLP